MERPGVGSRLEMRPRATQLGERALHHANAMPAHTVGIEWAVPCRTYSLRETHCAHHFDA
jgi:hypothetical protein